MTPLQNIPPWAIAIILCLLIATFTECTSNVATATLFLPVLASMVSSQREWNVSHIKKRTGRQCCLASVVQWSKVLPSVTSFEQISPIGVQHRYHSQWEPDHFPLFGHPSSWSFRLNLFGPLPRAPPPINNLPNTPIQSSALWCCPPCCCWRMALLCPLVEHWTEHQSWVAKDSAKQGVFK